MIKYDFQTICFLYILIHCSVCFFKDIFRRSVDIRERNFLREHGVVTEMQCDLGILSRLYLILKDIYNSHNLCNHFLLSVNSFCFLNNL